MELAAFFGLDPLSSLIFLPALFAFIIGFLPQLLRISESNIKLIVRWLALLFSLLLTWQAVDLFLAFDQSGPTFQNVVKSEWFQLLNASWHLGIDGISVTMVLLTGVLTPLAILISWEIEDRAPMHLALILFFQTGLMGVFVAMDLMIFFLFYELSLVPMYFIIDQWGGPNRKYAATKFMIYSVGGTLGMLLATQLVGLTGGTYEIQELVRIWPSFTGKESLFLGISHSTVKALAFFGFFLAFCIKIPVWPFHTWLPDAHGEAPTAGSMLLAGVMLKLGAFGFIRLVIPLFPDIWIANINVLGFVTNLAGVFAFLAVLGIVLGAFAAWAQNDIKRLVAYSSVNHMGFVAIGLAVLALIYSRAWQEGSGEQIEHAIHAANGAVLQMFNHGLSSAGMFLLAGAIYHKTHTRDLREYGGFWVKAPIYGGIFIFTSMASLGLPGLNGFVSEFLVVRGTWPVYTWLTIIAMVGLLFTGAYILKGIRGVLHGPFNLRWRDTRLEIEWREAIAIAPLLILMLFTGLWPNWLLPTINVSILQLLSG